jgi:hypothetical protein
MSARDQMFLSIQLVINDMFQIVFEQFLLICIVLYWCEYRGMQHWTLSSSNSLWVYSLHILTEILMSMSAYCHLFITLVAQSWIHHECLIVFLKNCIGTKSAQSS